MNDEALYAKYPYIMPGSIESVPKGTVISCGTRHTITSHGKICVIKCLNADKSSRCMKTRIINVQDVGQVTLCKKCIRDSRNIRRRP